MRIFFHVEYRADSSRKVREDELPTLEKQLIEVQDKINEISKEIDHSRKQEMTLKEAGGECTYSIQYIVYSMQYTVCSIQYTVYSIQYTVYSINVIEKVGLGRIKGIKGIKHG